MSKLWAGPWIGTVGSPVTTGLFYMPLVITGFGNTLFTSGPQGTELDITSTQVTTATLSSTQIEVGWGASTREECTLTDIVDLPPSFAIVSATYFWGYWKNSEDQGEIPGSTGLINLAFDGTPVNSVFTKWPGSNTPVYLLGTLGSVPTLEDLLGSVWTAEQTNVYQGFFHSVAVATSTEFPSVMIYGACSR